MSTRHRSCLSKSRCKRPSPTNSPAVSRTRRFRCRLISPFLVRSLRLPRKNNPADSIFQSHSTPTVVDTSPIAVPGSPCTRYNDTVTPARYCCPVSTSASLARCRWGMRLSIAQWITSNGLGRRGKNFRFHHAPIINADAILIYHTPGFGWTSLLSTVQDTIFSCVPYLTAPPSRTLHCCLGNETCPLPQTLEHPTGVEIMKL